MKRLAEFLKIRPGEERMASLMIGLMLFASTGYAFGNTGVETLFFTRYGVQFLPYMYMALGLLSFFITMGITALLGRIRHEKLRRGKPKGLEAEWSSSQAGHARYAPLQIHGTP